MFYHRPVVNLHVHINLQLNRGEGQQNLTPQSGFSIFPVLCQDSSINNVPKTVKLGTKLE